MTFESRVDECFRWHDVRQLLEELDERDYFNELHLYRLSEKVEQHVKDVGKLENELMEECR